MIEILLKVALSTINRIFFQIKVMITLDATTLFLIFKNFHFVRIKCKDTEMNYFLMSVYPNRDVHRYPISLWSIRFGL